MKISRVPLAFVITKHFNIRPILLFFLCFFLLLRTSAQDVDALIREVNRLEAVPDEKACFAKCKEILKLQPLNIFALNKSSELCSRIGKREKVKSLRDSYYAAAKTYAGIVLKMDPENAEANCVMAMAMGRSSMANTGREKIDNAKDIKKHLDIALKKDPQNFKAWHILGRWHYEISNLNVLEKSAVNLFYGGMPSASIKESIQCFEKARLLAPGFILNYFEMSKAYKGNGDDDKAISYLNTMLSLPNQTEDDPTIKEWARVVLKQWQ